MEQKDHRDTCTVLGEDLCVHRPDDRPHPADGMPLPHAELLAKNNHLPPSVCNLGKLLLPPVVTGSSKMPLAANARESSEKGKAEITFQRQPLILFGRLFQILHTCTRVHTRTRPCTRATVRTHSGEAGGSGFRARPPELLPLATGSAA